MKVNYVGKKPALTTSGGPNRGRLWYVFELESERNAAYCESAFVMSVRKANFANQLYHKGNNLILEVKDEWVGGEQLKKTLFENIKKTTR